MRYLPLLADRVLNTPLLLDAEKAQTVLSILDGRIRIDREAPDDEAYGSDELDPHTNQFLGSQQRASGRSYIRSQDGVGILTINGSLVNRGAWIGARSGLVSYEGTEAAIREARADAEISSLIIDINTRGGEAGGMAALAGLIRETREQMRVVAVVNDVAASGGYGIASAANEIVVSPTSIVGSIGVVILHLDRSPQMEAAGVRPTLIHAGARKIDGNPFGPLSDEARASIEGSVSELYDLFLEVVAQGRGDRLTAAAARKTEAGTFMGQGAIDAGLADRIGTVNSVLAELSKPVSSGGNRKENVRMSTGNQDTVDLAAHEQAVTEAQTSGTKAATDRFSAILSAEGVSGDAGRMKAAVDLATKSPGMSADEVVAFVTANVPEAKAQSEGDGMPSVEERQRGSAEFGADADGKSGSGPDAAASWSKVVSKTNKRNGFK